MFGPEDAPLGSTFSLVLSLVWIFLFGLLVVFDQVGQVD